MEKVCKYRDFEELMYPKIEMEDSLEATENQEIFESCVDKAMK